MNTVDESLNHLIEAVRNSKEFQDYQIVKAKVEKYPEKNDKDAANGSATPLSYESYAMIIYQKRAFVNIPRKKTEKRSPFFGLTKEARILYNLYE